MLYNTFMIPFEEYYTVDSHIAIIIIYNTSIMFFFCEPADVTHNFDKEKYVHKKWQPYLKQLFETL